MVLALVIVIGPLTVSATFAQVGLPIDPPSGESDSCAGGVGLFNPTLCTIGVTTIDGNPAADGTVVVNLVAPAGSAVLSCADTPCTPQNNGQTLSLSCTSGAPPNSCVLVDFTIASPIAACLSTPTACSSTANLSSGGATVTVAFLAAPGNNGVGGVVLGSDSIGFSGPGVGTLLVTATPQLIPSNGTVASVISATFACGDQNVHFGPNGFPQSSLGFRNAPRATGFVNQPVLGTPDSAVCGAGLPGTFTFTAPRNVIFDNARTQEGVGCGLGQTVSPSGGQSAIPPYTSTLPLAFTCTGAAVLALGNGNPGDAPIQVTYASAVAGLSAVGSTLVTVSPSQQPVLSMSCSPSTIAAGGPGSLCTVLVADQNGVPMTLPQGATLTWSTTDTSRTIVLACGTGTFGALNPNTTPLTVPQLSPTTPCQLPSGIFPSQSNPFINGQATALVASPAGSSPGVVSISAILDIVAPPSTTCQSAPYVPVPINPLTETSLGFPAIAGCGAGNPVGFTGVASAFSTQTAAVLAANTGSLPNITSTGAAISIVANASGFQIAGTDSSTSQPLSVTSTAAPLVNGCNQIVATSTAGTPLAQLAGLVTPANSLVSMWAFNNVTKRWRAVWFADPKAPTDFSLSGGTAKSQQGSPTVAGTGGLAQVNNAAVPPGAQVTESYLLCVKTPATIASG